MKNLNEFINESFIIEGFFNSIFGTGTSINSFISKIRLGLCTLKKEDKYSIFSELDEKKIVYDKETKTIKYNGNVDYGIGFKKFKGVNALIPIKVSDRLSDKEMKQLADMFGKTKLGKEIYKHSSEFKAELKKKYAEQEAQDAKDPEKLAKKCAELLKKMKQIGDSSDKEYKELSEKFKELENKGKKIDERKFSRAYDKACDDLDVANTKPFKSSGPSHSHAGEDYGGGHSSYDNMGR